jgi:hypothetical protein
MNLRSVAFSLLSLQLLTGCVALNSTDRENGVALKLSAIKKVKAGKTTKAEIEEWFGKADSIVPAENRKGEFYHYKERTLERASFYFPSGSNTVDTISWEVFDEDPEQDLRTALQTYPDAKWEVKTVDWVNPHALPDECYFQDKRLGISIEFRRTRKEVTSLWWWDASRTPASSEKQKENPPKFCIGDHCSAGIRGEEWLKNSKWPLCGIPQ